MSVTCVTQGSRVCWDRRESSESPESEHICCDLQLRFQLNLASQTAPSLTVLPMVARGRHGVHTLCLSSNDKLTRKRLGFSESRLLHSHSCDGADVSQMLPFARHTDRGWETCFYLPCATELVRAAVETQAKHKCSPVFPWLLLSVQWVRGLSRHAKVVGSIPSQGTGRSQPMTVSMSGTAN